MLQLSWSAPCCAPWLSPAVAMTIYSTARLPRTVTGTARGRRQPQRDGDAHRCHGHTHRGHHLLAARRLPRRRRPATASAPRSPSSVSAPGGAMPRIRSSTRASAPRRRWSVICVGNPDKPEDAVELRLLSKACEDVLGSTLCAVTELPPSGRNLPWAIRTAQGSFCTLQQGTLLERQGRYRLLRLHGRRHHPWRTYRGDGLDGEGRFEPVSLGGAGDGIAACGSGARSSRRRCRASRPLRGRR